eukprot:TRINITY_DN6665_c0_g1_i1.p1 TRINITY_DN6665_c0_g1~~TRINITY_DN6665_c0_g1_i1.p1  ORF type:complete len:415 (+),score=111.76 TRINITY_DN6665_c0_g1_i1:242-1486(+)
MSFNNGALSDDEEDLLPIDAPVREEVRLVEDIGLAVSKAASARRAELAYYERQASVRGEQLERQRHQHDLMVESVQSKLQSLESDLSAAENWRAETSAFAGELRQRNNHLEEELRTLKADVKRQTELAAALNGRCERLEEEKQRLHHEVQRHRDTTEEIQSLRSRLLGAEEVNRQIKRELQQKDATALEISTWRGKYEEQLEMTRRLLGDFWEAAASWKRLGDVLHATNTGGCSDSHAGAIGANRQLRLEIASAQLLWAHLGGKLEVGFKRESGCASPLLRSGQADAAELATCLLAAAEASAAELENPTHRLKDRTSPLPTPVKTWRRDNTASTAASTPTTPRKPAMPGRRQKMPPLGHAKAAHAGQSGRGGSSCSAAAEPVGYYKRPHTAATESSPLAAATLSGDERRPATRG